MSNDIDWMTGEGVAVEIVAGQRGTWWVKLSVPQMDVLAWHAWRTYEEAEAHRELILDRLWTATR